MLQSAWVVHGPIWVIYESTLLCLGLRELCMTFLSYARVWIIHSLYELWPIWTEICMHESAWVMTDSTWDMHAWVYLSCQHYINECVISTAESLSSNLYQETTRVCLLSVYIMKQLEYGYCLSNETTRVWLLPVYIMKNTITWLLPIYITKQVEFDYCLRNN